MPRLRSTKKTWTVEHGLSELPNANSEHASRWKKFRLLLWKNWTIQSRHKWQIFMELFLPIFCSSILVIVRLHIPAEFITEPTKYYSFYVDSPPYLAIREICNEIYYTPKNPATDRLMEQVRDNHFTFPAKKYKVTGFKSEEALIKAYSDISLQLQEVKEEGQQNITNPEDIHIPILAGVIFTSKFDDNGESFSNEIEYTLRFPAKQRAEFDLITERFGLKAAWYTELVYPFLQLPGPRAKFQANGGLPGYYDEGFLFLQNAIETTLVKQVLNDTEEVKAYEDYEIELHRFPFPPYIEDKFLFAMQGVLPMLIMLSLIYPLLNIARSIVLEKEKKLKESMKMMGLSNYLHWVAWVVKSFTFLLIAIILMVLLLKIRFSNLAVVEFSDPLVLYMVITVFAIQAVSIAFLVSSLTNTANSSAIVTAVLWFIFFVPYFFLQPRYYLLSRTTKILASMFTNAPIALGCFILCIYEGRGVGLQWNNLFTGIGPGDNFCMFDCLAMNLANALFYCLLTLYIESVWPGEYGVPLPWYYPFTTWYWTNGIRKPTKTERNLRRSENTVPANLLEAEPNAYAGVRIQGLTKNFGKKMAVKNLHLNMYENQITALLGHNGAGKTTTMSMLTGLYPPTSGTALISDFDIGYDMNSVRSSLGLCPQHDILFEDLTVEEHLRFFCLLKGFPEELVPHETTRMLKVLGLEDKRRCQAHTLSGGMRRKLSVSIAFCGGSKVVLLDEPTSGMDPAARRSCWDLIQSEKKGRTVLLSTHFMEEADLLGDRIAIMADGELQCCGTSLFLKKKFGGGYHLTIVKKQDCEVENITSLLRERIPDVAIDQNVGAELSYSLPDDKSHLFAEMFSELEARKTELGIDSYGASITTMEEVFIKVGREAERKVTEEYERKHGKNGRSSSNDVPHVNLSLGNLTDTNSKTNLHMQSRRNTGIGLILQQFRAMLTKKMIYVYRNRLLLFGQLAIPVLYLCVVLGVSKTLPALANAPPLVMDLEEYAKFGDIVTTVHCENPSPVCEVFKETTLENNYELQEVRNKSVVNFIVDKQLQDLSNVNYRYIVAYDEVVKNDSSEVKIIGYFNNEVLHAPPLILNMIRNSILKSLEKNLTIKVTNYPMPYTKLETGTLAGSLLTLGFQVGYNLCFGLSFLAASFAVFLVAEREIRSKHLQYIAGVKFYVFWISNFIVDFACFSLTCSFIIIVLHVYGVDEYTSLQTTLNLIVLFAIYGASVIPLMYLCSYMFTEPSTAFIRIGMLNVFTGMLPMIVVAIVTIAEFNLGTLADKLNDVFVIFPSYAVGNGMVQVSKNILLKEQCANIFSSEESYELACVLSNIGQFCCTTVKENPWDWEVNGIGKNIFALSMVGLISVVVLLICELRVWEYFKKSSAKLESSSVKANKQDEIIVEDEDVASERVRIKKTPLKTLHETDNLILRDLTKYYGKFLAVDKLNLGVQRGQTFGLLGVNGAGKTTTFKMLTGDYPCTSGDALVYLHSIRTDIQGVHQNMGYCPQFDGLIGEMTGRETLRMFGRLRGIWETDIDDMITNIANDLIFTQHLDKLVKNYSGGNKRKLSTAMALVGSPPIVFLDEPTTGMDPVARRHLWNAISIIRDRGTSIVLTSHSMEECEALCSRLAIMVNGKFRCLGSPQHLKNKFGEGYTLIAQTTPAGVGQDYTREKQETGLRRSSSMILRKTQAPQSWEKVLDGLRNYIEDSFPGAALKDIHPGFVHYHIPPSQSITWGRLFETMEIAKDKFRLDAYSVGQTSLEQVFLNFAKSQIDIAENEPKLTIVDKFFKLVF